MTGVQVAYTAGAAGLGVAVLVVSLLRERDRPLAVAAVTCAALVAVADLLLRGAPGALAETRDLWRNVGFRVLAAALAGGTAAWLAAGVRMPRNGVSFVAGLVTVVAGFVLLKPWLDGVLT